MLYKQVSLASQSVVVAHPDEIEADLALAFGSADRGHSDGGKAIAVAKAGPNTFSVQSTVAGSYTGLAREDLHEFIMDAVTRSLVHDLSDGLALHAGAVTTSGKIVLVAGATGAGKSTLIAWLTDKGFKYLSDELVVIDPHDGHYIDAFGRAIALRAESAALTAGFQWISKDRTLRAASRAMIDVPAAQRASKISEAPPPEIAAIVFPEFMAGEALQIEHLSTSSSVLELLKCNLNGRNLNQGGLSALKQLAQKAPALKVRYGGFSEIDGVLDHLITAIADGRIEGRFLKRLAPAFAKKALPHRNDGATSPHSATTVPVSRPIPEATPPRGPRKLTIGMATYDDFDGTYFTIQSLRLNNPQLLDELEFLVIDNHPDGPCAEALKALDAWIPNYRYIPFNAASGTASRDQVFKLAAGEFVMCLDCHVLLAPGALRRLIDYFDAHPKTDDLLQGPLIYDDLKNFSTQFDPVWRSGMYGTWGADDRGAAPDGAPFEIVMQGLGLFACRRDAWPGFNSAFRGFGGEEGYIHEKFRRHGGKVLCLPFLRWLHRFARPMGVPYVNRWEDRVRNYVIGHMELELDTGPLKAHFEELLGASAAAQIWNNLAGEFPALTAHETRTVPNVVAAAPIEKVSISAPSARAAKTPVRVSCLMATYGRYTHACQALACFLQQTELAGAELIIFNQHTVPLRFDHPHVRVINEPGPAMPLRGVRQRMHDLADPAAEFVHWWDDDDLYLPWHLRDCLQNINGHAAWKPARCWLSAAAESYSLERNNFEGSCMLRSDFVRSVDFASHPDYIDHPAFIEACNAGLISTTELGGRSSYIYRWATGAAHFSANIAAGSPEEQVARTELWRQKNNDFRSDGIMHAADLTSEWQRFLLATRALCTADEAKLNALELTLLPEFAKPDMD